MTVVFAEFEEMLLVITKHVKTQTSSKYRESFLYPISLRLYMGAFEVSSVSMSGVIPEGIPISIMAIPELPSFSHL